MSERKVGRHPIANVLPGATIVKYKVQMTGISVADQDIRLF
jgi:hypothetical protein